MNCQAIQNKILALPDPRQLPDAMRLHVESCSACKAWAAEAARLEGILERLPIPAAPAGRKSALVGQLERGEPLVVEPARSAKPAERETFLSYLQRNATLIGGLAAAVLVALGAWAILSRNSIKPQMASVPDDPFLKKMVERDLALARAETPIQRFQVLGDMADDLAGQARNLARVADAEELRDLARCYQKVVDNAIVKQAEKLNDRVLDPADRRARAEAIRAMTKQLAETAAETDKLMAEAPQHSKPALQKIVNTAREGQKQINITTNELRGGVD